MQHIEKSSCIKFVKKQNDELNYIYIFRNDSSLIPCQAYFGYQGGGFQVNCLV